MHHGIDRLSGVGCTLVGAFMILGCGAFGNAKGGKRKDCQGGEKGRDSHCDCLMVIGKVIMLLGKEKVC